MMADSTTTQVIVSVGHQEPEVIEDQQENATPLTDETEIFVEVTPTTPTKLDTEDNVILTIYNVLASKKDQHFDWEMENIAILRKMSRQEIVVSNRNAQFFSVCKPIVKYKVGLRWLTEFQPWAGATTPPWYLCHVCREKITVDNIADHVLSLRHRILTMKRHDRHIYEKLQLMTFKSMKSLRWNVMKLSRKLARETSYRPLVMAEMTTEHETSLTTKILAQMVRRYKALCFPKTTKSVKKTSDESTTGKTTLKEKMKCKKTIPDRKKTRDKTVMPGETTTSITITFGQTTRTDKIITPGQTKETDKTTMPEETPAQTTTTSRKRSAESGKLSPMQTTGLRKLKDVELGKTTPQYQNYIRLVPKYERDHTHPRTPDLTANYSRRSEKRLHFHKDRTGDTGCAAVMGSQRFQIEDQTEKQTGINQIARIKKPKGFQTEDHIEKQTGINQTESTEINKAMSRSDYEHGKQLRLTPNRRRRRRRKQKEHALLEVGKNISDKQCDKQWKVSSKQCDDQSNANHTQLCNKDGGNMNVNDEDVSESEELDRDFDAIIAARMGGGFITVDEIWE